MRKFVTTPTPTIVCSQANCVEITGTSEGFDFTSTLGADKGRVSYTPAEVDAFLTDVKAGLWDGLHERAARAKQASALV